MKADLKITKFLNADFQHDNQIAKRAPSHTAGVRANWYPTPMESSEARYVPRAGKILLTHVPNNSTPGNLP